MKKLLSLLAIVSALNVLTTPVAHADPMREFLTTSTYGALGGALVGAASLAFTEKPDGNLNNIARGASLGLYIGMMMGVYLAYYVPKPSAKSDFSQFWYVSPKLSDSMKLEGAQIDMTVARF